MPYCFSLKALQKQIIFMFCDIVDLMRGGAYYLMILCKITSFSSWNGLSRCFNFTRDSISVLCISSKTNEYQLNLIKSVSYAHNLIQHLNKLFRLANEFLNHNIETRAFLSRVQVSSCSSSSQNSLKTFVKNSLTLGITMTILQTASFMCFYFCLLPVFM